MKWIQSRLFSKSIDPNASKAYNKLESLDIEPNWSFETMGSLLFDIVAHVKKIDEDFEDGEGMDSNLFESVNRDMTFVWSL